MAMPKNRKPKFRITVTLELDPETVQVPEDINCKDIDNYVREALSRWGGQFDPLHPLHSTNIKKVSSLAKYLVR